MASLKLFLVFIVGFVSKTISFNPLLTYTIRYKKMIMQPNITASYTVDEYKGIQYVNANFTINTDKVIDNMVIIFDRCDYDGINCEYFQSWKLKDICSKLKEKNQMWSSWYSSFDPPMVCPINKKNYIIKNGTIEIGPALAWYPDATNYQWKVLQKFYAGDIFVGSYMGIVVPFGYRKRNKLV